MDASAIGAGISQKVGETFKRDGQIDGHDLGSGLGIKMDRCKVQHGSHSGFGDLFEDSLGSGGEVDVESIIVSIVKAKAFVTRTVKY